MLTNQLKNQWLELSSQYKETKREMELKHYDLVSAYDTQNYSLFNQCLEKYKLAIERDIVVRNELYKVENKLKQRHALKPDQLHQW